MQTISAQLQTAIDSPSFTPLVKFLVDFDYNRILSPTIQNVASTKSEDLYPIEEVVTPKHGISSGYLKATTDGAKVYSMDDDVPRHRAVSEQDVYKVYRGPDRSLTAPPHNLNGMDIQIDYASDIEINKITAIFEVGYARPDVVSVYVDDSANPGIWQTVGTFDVTASNGKLELYLQNNSTWSTSYFQANQNTVTVRGLRIVPSSMSAGDAYCYLHYATVSRIIDFSDRVIDANVEKNQDTAEISAPIGTLYADSMSVTMENTDGTFDIGSNIHGLMKYRIPCELHYGFTTTSGDEYIKQGDFYITSWGLNDSSYEFTIEGVDILGVMKEDRSPIMFCEDYTSAQLIREMLYRAGYTDHTLQMNTTEVVPYYWLDGDLGLLEAMDELVKSFPATVLANETGGVRVLDYDTMTSNVDKNGYSVAPVLDLDADQNLVSMSHEYTLQFNSVGVNYRDYGPKVGDGVTQGDTELVWQPEGVKALNSVKIAESIGLNDTTIKLDMAPLVDYYNLYIDSAPLSTSDFELLPTTADEVFDTFPNEGFFNIGAERMRWTSKAKVGADYVFTVERGYLGSPQKAHNIDVPVSVDFEYAQGGDVGAYTITNDGGFFQLRSNSSSNLHKWYLHQIDNNSNGSDPFRIYGMRFMFPEERNHNCVGFVINKQSGSDKGYYFEVFKNAKNTGDIGEVRCYKVVEDDIFTANARVGVPHFVGGGRRGYDFIVDNLVWHTLEVFYQDGRFFVYLNGAYITDFDEFHPGQPGDTSGYAGTGANTNYPTGDFAVYVRGDSTVNFDWAYATKVSPGDPKYYKRHSSKRRNFVSTFDYQVQKDVLTEGGDITYKEWVPTAHEGLHIRGDYDKFPMQYASIFLSNRDEVAILRQNLSSFSYDIYLENITSAGNAAFLNAGDIASVNIDGTLDIEENLFFIFGRPIISSADLKLDVVNLSSLRRSGRRHFELDSPWTQGEVDAERVGKIIESYWGNPLDVVQVEWVPNPAIQIGDVVTVTSPVGHSPAGSKYHVIGISISIGDGLSGTPTLRERP